MKTPATIISLLIAASIPLAASAAVALPSSTSSSLRDTAAAPIQVVKHRKSHVSHDRRSGPAAEDSYGYYGSYNPYGGEGVDDWSHWSPSYHPGWPCVSGTPSETSAYPAWEVRPQCQ
jgi:hypothetical protein